MAAPLLRKGIPLLRLRLQRYNLLAAGIPPSPRRPWCAAAESTGLEEEVSSAEKSSAVPSVRDPKKYHMLDDPDYRKWKDKEEEILRDIQPIISLAREILHSNRYKDGEGLTVADEEAVVDMLLRYHPHSEDKIGCGLDSIMVSFCWHYLILWVSLFWFELLDNQTYLLGKKTSKYFHSQVCSVNQFGSFVSG
uniref:Uncharacterized protein n=1 Tax=Gossypium raimondii TaxID=29730 RepID=A0A0D2SDK7_GOSRA|nr:hypothetical protein B456_005G101200 [Gossypium raimondii]